MTYTKLAAKGVARPFVKWVGGKQQLMSQYKDLLPFTPTFLPEKYVEPMVGGGGAMLFTMLAHYQFKSVYISDINSELINTYQVIKRDVNHLITDLRRLNSEFHTYKTIGKVNNFYYSRRHEFNSTELNDRNKIRKAALFILLNKLGFNGLYRVNSRGEFNVPPGSYKNPLILDENNLRAVSDSLQLVTIKHGDYTQSRKYIDNKTFVYFDPPYRPLTTTASFTAYSENSFNDNDQITLANYIKEISALGAKIMVSNSDPKNIDPSDNFFDTLFQGFDIKRVSAKRAINSRAELRGPINELVIRNYTNELIQSRQQKQHLKEKRDFDSWLKTLCDDLSDWTYYVDFPKVYKNVENIKIELNLLNSLIGEKDIENKFRELIARYPDVLKAIPILLAKRETEIPIKTSEKSSLFHFLVSRVSEYEVDDYVVFMQKTGLFDLLQRSETKSIVDYATGVEVGMDTNARKNRTGKIMESLVENHLRRIGLVINKDYFTQMPASHISNNWGLDLSPITHNAKLEKRFDFVVYRNNKLFAIETNFYNKSGSKLNEIARSYKQLGTATQQIHNFTFVWITDGAGWKSSRNNLCETFETLTHVYNLADLEEGF